jgi:hypothetical protein
MPNLRVENVHPAQGGADGAGPANTSALVLVEITGPG